MSFISVDYELQTMFDNHFDFGFSRGLISL